MRNEVRSSLLGAVLQAPNESAHRKANPKNEAETGFFKLFMGLNIANIKDFVQFAACFDCAKWD